VNEWKNSIKLKSNNKIVILTTQSSLSSFFFYIKKKKKKKLHIDNEFKISKLLLSYYPLENINEIILKNI